MKFSFSFLIQFFATERKHQIFLQMIHYSQAIFSPFHSYFLASCIKSCQNILASYMRISVEFVRGVDEI